MADEYGDHADATLPDRIAALEDTVYGS